MDVELFSVLKQKDMTLFNCNYQENGNKLESKEFAVNEQIR